MAGDTEKPRLLQIAELLVRNDVEFMVVGGQAAVLLCRRSTSICVTDVRTGI